jgi:hypothetical protein
MSQNKTFSLQIDYLRFFFFYTNREVTTKCPRKEKGITDN